MLNSNKIRRNLVRDEDYCDVIDLTARRRGLLERRGADPVEIAIHLCADTGEFRYWADDLGDDGDDGWAA